MDFQEIVTGRRLRRDLPARVGSAAHRVAVQRRPGGNQGGAEALAGSERGAQLEVRGRSEHAAHAGDAANRKQGQHPFQLGALVARHVGVHVGETRHQVTIRAVDDRRALRDRYAIHGTDDPDAPGSDDHGLRAQHVGGRHRHDVDVDKSRRSAVSAGRAQAEDADNETRSQ